MAKKTAKKRREAQARATAVERSKGTSKKDIYSPAPKKKLSKKQRIILISAISAVVVAAIVACLFIFVFNKDSDVELEGIVYAYNSDMGGYEISAASTDIVEASIPETIDGIPVVAI